MEYNHVKLSVLDDEICVPVMEFLCRVGLLECWCFRPRGFGNVIIILVFFEGGACVRRRGAPLPWHNGQSIQVCFYERD